MTRRRSDVRVRVTIRVSDGRGHLLWTGRSAGSGPGRATHPFTFRCDLPRGTYTVRAYATDRAGNAQSRMTRGKPRRALTAVASLRFVTPRRSVAP